MPRPSVTPPSCLTPSVRAGWWCATSASSTFTIWNTPKESPR
ncbi:hypothetical protein EVA_08506 [gut metagenome]|uniref:Uncharacterized protein n=1 Tax=gut metagenome TaxID=749906 RepID=J9CT41_9ZZZZ